MRTFAERSNAALRAEYSHKKNREELYLPDESPPPHKTNFYGLVRPTREKMNIAGFVQLLRSLYGSFLSFC